MFFDQFGLKPDFMLNIGQGTPNAQMANVMLGLEKVCSEYMPDLLMVVGDVNSTFAAAPPGYFDPAKGGGRNVFALFSLPLAR